MSSAYVMAFERVSVGVEEQGVLVEVEWEHEMTVAVVATSLDLGVSEVVEAGG